MKREGLFRVEREFFQATIAMETRRKKTIWRPPWHQLLPRLQNSLVRLTLRRKKKKIVS